MKLRILAPVLVMLMGAAFCLAPAAVAEDGPEQGEDLKAKIKKQMAEILELMKQNEQALLELSTGGDASTRRIDVPVPEGEKAEGAAAGAPDGGKIRKKLEELVKKQRGSSGKIPAELKRLVEMIPL